MKTKILIVLLIVFSLNKINGQTGTFNNEGEVTRYMDGKTFKNSDNGMTIEYGYISSYNTYGIKVKNQYGNRFYFINVKISCYGRFADLYGMSTDNGSNFGFRLYRDRLIVGKGEPGEQTFYLN